MPEKWTITILPFWEGFCFAFNLNSCTPSFQPPQSIDCGKLLKKQNFFQFRKLYSGSHCTNSSRKKTLLTNRNGGQSVCIEKRLPHTFPLVPCKILQINRISRLERPNNKTVALYRNMWVFCMTCTKLKTTPELLRTNHDDDNDDCSAIKQDARAAGKGKKLSQKRQSGINTGSSWNEPWANARFKGQVNAPSTK